MKITENKSGNDANVIFDSMAQSYDDDFTNTTLGRLLRKRVWRVIMQHFHNGNHILEINCGTGEDAIWMAKNGMFVTATDASAEMIKIAKEKLSNEDISVRRRVSFQQKSFDEIESVKVLDNFDGILSNFGGLNTINNWNELAVSLSKITKLHAKIILVPMGKWCWWEIFWFSIRFDFSPAFRRFRQPAKFRIRGEEMKIWYPTVNQMKQSFSSHFTMESTSGLGIILPPSCFKKWVDRFPKLFTWLDATDNVLGNLLPFWGDHFIVVFKRK